MLDYILANTHMDVDFEENVVIMNEMTLIKGLILAYLHGRGSEGADEEELESVVYTVRILMEHDFPPVLD